MAHLALNPQQHQDGVDLSPLLKGEPLDRGPIYWHYPHFGNQGGHPAGAIRDGNLKLIQNYTTDSVELYDVVADPGEQHDLGAARTADRDRLLEKLKSWQKSVGAQFPKKL